MPKGYVIDAEGIKKLREDHEILRKMLLQMEQKIKGSIGAGIRMDSEFVKVTERITPRDTSTTALEKRLGLGKAEVYNITQGSGDHDGDSFEKLTDSEGNGTYIDVFNSNRVSVPVGAYIHVKRNFRSGLWMVGEIQTAVAVTGESGVTARSYATAGTGTVMTHYFNAGVLTRTLEELTVYNMSLTAIANDTFITIKRCSLSEDWIVDAEDCG